MASKDAVSLFLAYGAEDYFLDRDVVRAKAWKGRQVVELDGKETSEEELCDVLSTPFTSGVKKTVLLDNAQKLKLKKDLLAFYAEPRDDSVVLVAIVREEKLSAVWSQLAKQGKVYEYKKLKTWDNNNEVIPWISQEAGRLGLTLDDKAAEAIYRLVGADLYRLESELRKLLLLVGKGTPVTPEHLSLVVAQGASVDVFQVIDAASDKNVRRALGLADKLFAQEGDDAFMPLLYGLMKQTERMLVARMMLDKSASEEDIAARVTMHPWRCKSFFLPMVRKHTTTGLRAVFERLCQLDVDAKTGARARRALLDLTLVQLAQGAPS